MENKRMKDLTDTLLDHENLTLVLDSLKLGIIAHTPDRIITVFNKEAERITGYYKEEVIGKDCHIVFESPFCGRKCSFCNGTPDFSSGTKEYPLNILAKDGSTHQLEMTVSAIISHDNEFKGVLASFRDVTESFDLSLKAENLSS